MFRSIFIASDVTSFGFNITTPATNLMGYLMIAICKSCNVSTVVFQTKENSTETFPKKPTFDTILALHHWICKVSQYKVGL